MAEQTEEKQAAKKPHAEDWLAQGWTRGKPQYGEEMLIYGRGGVGWAIAEVRTSDHPDHDFAEFAADLIASAPALKAENERLRAALQRVINAGDPTASHIARAALEGGAE